MSLPRHAFGRTGLQVAPLGIGSISPEHGIELAIRNMNALLDAGANLVDTAQCYPGSEDMIGQHLAHRRHEMVLVSKCGHHEILADGSMRSRAISMTDVDTALKRLNTDYLDAMLLHSYDYDLLVQGDALAVLEAARQAGKIRHIGYSGDNERLEWAVRCPLIDVVEVSVNLVDQHNLKEALPHALRQGIGVIAKRPLANAAWRFAAEPLRANEHHQLYARRFAQLKLDPHAFGCDNMAELALRFTISLEEVSCAIVSCTSTDHLAANLHTVAQGTLSKADINEISAAFDACQLASAGSWRACN